MICALAACALAACAITPTSVAQPGSPTEMLTVVGSTAAAPLLDALGQAYQKNHPEVTLSRGRGTYNATQAQGAIHKGDLSWAVISGSPDRQIRWSAPLAVDAIAVIVHPDNPLSSLTRTQLHQVFSGRTWRWSELGVEGVGGEIVVLSRETGSGTRAAFVEQALRERPEDDPTPLAKTAVLRFSGEAVAAYVAEHPAAIGYLALGVLRAAPENASKGGAVKVLAIENVMPGPKQVSGGGYPLSLPIYLVARAEPTGVARLFLDFCLSPAGQRLVARQYVPVRE